jgi:dihydroorotate dehydrogenase electron transfer subunit
MIDDRYAAALPRKYTITRVRQETTLVRRYTLDGALDATPGQFVMAWLPGLDEKPFSLMGADPLTLAVAGVGPFTEALARLGAGDSLWVRGPFGQGFQLRGERPLLVAGGYGAAPLAFLARAALRECQSVGVVIAAREKALLLLAGDFEELGCRVWTCTDDGSDGQRMLADAAATHALDTEPFDGLYACGPGPMLDAIERLARARGLPAQLSREAYMRCGIGVCGSCTCGDQLVCQDGPVFEIP